MHTLYLLAMQSLLQRWKEEGSLDLDNLPDDLTSLLVRATSSTRNFTIYVLQHHLSKLLPYCEIDARVIEAATRFAPPSMMKELLAWEVDVAAININKVDHYQELLLEHGASTDKDSSLSTHNQDLSCVHAAPSLYRYLLEELVDKEEYTDSLLLLLAAGCLDLDLVAKYHQRTTFLGHVKALYIAMIVGQARTVKEDRLAVVRFLARDLLASLGGVTKAVEYFSCLREMTPHALGMMDILVPALKYLYPLSYELETPKRSRENLEILRLLSLTVKFSWSEDIVQTMVGWPEGLEVILPHVHKLHVLPEKGHSKSRSLVLQEMRRRKRQAAIDKWRGPKSNSAFQSLRLAGTFAGTINMFDMLEDAGCGRL